MSSDLTSGENLVKTNNENQFGQSIKNDEIFDDASLNLFDFADPSLTNNNHQFLSKNTNDSTNCNNGMIRNDELNSGCHVSTPHLEISNQLINENTKNMSPSDSNETAKNKKAKANAKKRKKETGNEPNDGAILKATKKKRKYDPNAQFKRKNIK